MTEVEVIPGPDPMSRMTAAERKRLEHFGDGVHHGGHTSNSDFDFYCIAHGEDYAPKYLDGAVCHDGMGEGFCHPDCRACPEPCPIKPCPLVDEYGDVR